MHNGNQGSPQPGALQSASRTGNILTFMDTIQNPAFFPVQRQIALATFRKGNRTTTGSLSASSSGVKADLR